MSHFALATFLCVLVATAIKNEPEAGMAYAYLAFFDFPFFTVLNWMDDTFRHVVGYNLSNVIFPFISFSIIGSLAYTFLGFIIGRIIEALKERLQ